MEAEANTEATRRFSLGPRSILYGLIFFLLFALTVAELGLVSQQLHRYGNDYNNYASAEYKHGLGILLFAVLVSLIATMSHFWLGVGSIGLCAFIIAVFFGTGAGILQRVTPFKGTSCGKAVDEYPESWRPYWHECSRIVSIQAIAWALWGAYIFLLIGTLIHKFEIRIRPTPEAFYFSKV